MGKSKKLEIPIESSSDLNNFSSRTLPTMGKPKKGKPVKESASKVYTLPLPLQIRAKNTDHLYHGFPYPKSLITYGISKVDWTHIWQRIFQSLLPWMQTALNRTHLGVPHVLEEILDLVAHWDQEYFRRKGLLMRLDMPGEEKFGLYTMLIYHDGPHKHFHHEIGATEKIREKGFLFTRVVLDSISVLEDSQKAYDHGWTNWNKACEYAKKMKLETFSPPMNNEPWDFNKLARVDRWPPSKHVYYDRFRGKEILISGERSSHYVFIPDWDSMDQRGGTFAHPKPVVACDECPFRIMRKGDQWPEAAQKRVKIDIVGGFFKALVGIPN